MLRLRKIYLTAILGLFTSLAFAQTGTLKGVITDRITGKPVDFANVVIMKNGIQSGNIWEFRKKIEKSNKGNNCLTAMKKPNGELEEDPNKIL